MFFCLIFSEDFDHIKNFVANFKQTTIQQGQKIIYSGRVFAAKPSHARWIYTSPLQKEVYINGEDIVIYEPRLFQATYSKTEKKIDILQILRLAKRDHNSLDAVKTPQILTHEKSEPSLFTAPDPKKSPENPLENSAKESEFIVGQEQDISDFSTTEEVARSYRLEYEGVEYKILAKNGALEKISFIDEFDNAVTIEFSHMRVNLQIPPQTFVFVPRAGVDLITAK